MLSRRKFRGPDFFLVLDVDNRERKSWVVWQEGMRFPDIIIELLSDTTREIDKGEKKTLYERVFHTYRVLSLRSLVSRTLLATICRAVGINLSSQMNKEGCILPWSDLYLAVRDGWLRWMTPEGIILPTPEELAKQERQRAEPGRATRATENGATRRRKNDNAPTKRSNC